MRRKARRFLSALLTFSLILGNVMVARADDDTGVSAAAATESVGWPKANMSAVAPAAQGRTTIPQTRPLMGIQGRSGMVNGRGMIFRPTGSAFSWTRIMRRPRR